MKREPFRLKEVLKYSEDELYSYLKKLLESLDVYRDKKFLHVLGNFLFNDKKFIVIDKISDNKKRIEIYKLFITKVSHPRISLLKNIFSFELTEEKKGILSDKAQERRDEIVISIFTEKLTELDITNSLRDEQLNMTIFIIEQLALHNIKVTHPQFVEYVARFCNINFNLFSVFIEAVANAKVHSGFFSNAIDYYEERFGRKQKRSDRFAFSVVMYGRDNSLHVLSRKGADYLTSWSGEWIPELHEKMA
ncbi:hypothetical protein COB64_01800 [Candidatus Wolfebacteria bacterium]|nr:MAG: hypothetical protein COB64_01800 [Candidatus Wolfebacteria bacterium]